MCIRDRSRASPTMRAARRPRPTRVSASLHPLPLTSASKASSMHGAPPCQLRPVDRACAGLCTRGSSTPLLSPALAAYRGGG
eukprot:11307518-Alexandrium_andersonii.AAC.1